MSLLASSVAYLLGYLLLFAGLWATLGLGSKTSTDVGVAPSLTSSTTAAASATTTRATASSTRSASVTQTVTRTTQTVTVTTQTTVAQPGAGSEQWPAYNYPGPYDLCTVATYPASGLMRAGDGPNGVIQSAQEALISLNWDAAPTGSMDAFTVAQLKRYQAQHGLVADGTLGQQTWSSLYSGLHSYGKC